MKKPTISPDALAQITEAVPGRIRKKFDAAPDAANAWQWTEDGADFVIAADDQTVKLSGPSISSPDQVSCTCLLSPRCLHVLSVVQTLALDDASQTEDAQPEPAEVAEVPFEGLDAAQIEAAEIAWKAAANLLERGIVHATLTQHSDILRALHLARLRGLWRLSAAGQRVAESMRFFREKSAAFDRGLFADELHEFLLVAHMLRTKPSLEWVGRARRKYEDAGSLKLSGLLGEPVVTRTGYAGVVVYLTDGTQCWTLSDVMPGDASRVSGAWKGGLSIGDISMSPMQLSRSGLLVQGATASPEGRLGSGQKVKAVTTSGTPLAEHPKFKIALKDQIQAIFEAKQAGTSRAGYDFLFISAEVLGGSQDALIVRSLNADGNNAILRAVPANFVAALKYADNTRMLARAPGLRFRAVVRLVDAKIDTIEILAIAPELDVEEGEVTLELPPEFEGRLSFGLDAIKPEYVGAKLSAPHPVQFGAIDLESAAQLLRRRVIAAAYGGHIATQAATQGIQRDVARLSSWMMNGASSELSALLSASRPKERTLTGELATLDENALALAWCRTSTFLNLLREEVVRAGY